MAILTAAAIQMRVRRSLEENLAEAEALISEAADKDAQLVCVPEYFLMTSEFLSDDGMIQAIFKKSIELLETASKKHQIIIAGSVLEPLDDGFYNVCHIYENGVSIGEQPKVHPVEIEENLGLKRAEKFEVFASSKGKLGVLVCADVQYPEAGRVLGLKGADVVFNPVVSLYSEEDVTKEARASLFISRALDNGYFLIKAGGVGVSPSGAVIVGRSLIAAPWGILAKARDEHKPDVVIAPLDMTLLEKVREKNYSLQRRTKKAYTPLIE